MHKNVVNRSSEYIEIKKMIAKREKIVYNYTCIHICIHFRGRIASRFKERKRNYGISNR